jgi:zinc transport system ATP-binding protein
MAMITCRDAVFGYEGRSVVSGLNFQIDPGDCLCIVGENGSGKTTALKGLLGLLPPRQGSVLFGDGLRPRDFGYLSQRADAEKEFPASVREIVISGCLNGLGTRPFYGRRDKYEAMEKMKLLGIEGLAMRNFTRLSGGQQQRVLLARALCAAKRVLVLDEPGNGLDARVRQDLYELLKTSVRRLGLTVIMVTHDLRDADGFANRILHLDNRQVFFGTPEEYQGSGLMAPATPQASTSERGKACCRN